MAQVKKGARLALPKGFTSVGGFGESWKPTRKGESIQGVILGFKKVKKKSPKKGEDPFFSIVTLKTDLGEMQIFKSAMLAALFALKKGAKVYVRFDGVGKAFKKGHNAPRNYTVAVAK